MLIQTGTQSLESAEALDRALGFPSLAYPVIHIAGSNGKGSVALKIAKALELSGYRVGLYTSPHLFSLQERIVIGQELIPEEVALEGIAKMQALGARSFFESMTFVAFEFFKEKGVDVAVIETGLGGRFDATNVVQPILSIITSISREHTSLLGDQLEKIAQEKAGILKENIPVVLGPKARFQAIYEKGKQLNCPLYLSKKISHFFDEENSAIAELSLGALSTHFTLMPSAIHEGIALRPPCRFEKINGVIFDVAHNPDAIFHLIQALHHFYPDRTFRFVAGFSKDKEFDLCLDHMAKVASMIHLVEAPSERAASVALLEKTLSSEKCMKHASIQEGVSNALLAARLSGDQLVVCGSFYIMQEAKEALSRSYSMS